MSPTTPPTMPPIIAPLLLSSAELALGVNDALDTGAAVEGAAVAAVVGADVWAIISTSVTSTVPPKAAPSLVLSGVTGVASLDVTAAWIVIDCLGASVTWAVTVCPSAWSVCSTAEVSFAAVYNFAAAVALSVVITACTVLGANRRNEAPVNRRVTGL